MIIDYKYINRIHQSIDNMKLDIKCIKYIRLDFKY